MTANEPGRPQFVNFFKQDYDEFLYHFFSYIHGCGPAGEPLSRQGGNFVKEAFQYAVDMDVWSPTNATGDIIRAHMKKTQPNLICEEIPQMKCDIVGELIL